MHGMEFHTEMCQGGIILLSIAIFPPFFSFPTFSALTNEQRLKVFVAMLPTLWVESSKTYRTQNIHYNVGSALISPYTPSGWTFICMGVYSTQPNRLKTKLVDITFSMKSHSSGIRNVHSIQ